MVAFDYNEAQNDAADLIAEFGREYKDGDGIQRTTTTGPAWDPTAQTTTVYPCTAVVLDYATNLIDGTLILRTDRRVLVSVRGLSIEPTVTDKFVADGVTYTIVPPVKPLKPAATVVLYELQCRV